MRPVNLIPPEDRRGDRAPLRTGVLPYMLIGVLVVALAAISAVVLTGNQVADREAELATLEAEEAEARARAEALRPYAQFAALSEARDATVTSLAQSRFDWERVLRELALVMPEDVWLTTVTGTVAPGVQLADAAEVGIRSEVEGPALSIIGCGSGHEAVAAFSAALEDLDGVTRVTVDTSERPVGESSGSGESGAGGSEDCRTRDFIAQFEIVAAFDEVPAPEAATAPSAPAVPPAAESEPAGAPSGEQSGETAQAANVVPGVAR